MCFNWYCARVRVCMGNKSAFPTNAIFYIMLTLLYALLFIIMYVILWFIKYKTNEDLLTFNFVVFYLFMTSKLQNMESKMRITESE